MRFTLSSTSLCGKLTALARVINTKNTLPILNDFVFKTEENQLRLTASDGENTIVTTMPLNESDCNCAFAIASNNILDAVRGLAEQPIAIELGGDDDMVTITHQNGEIMLPIANAEEYPQMPGIEGDHVEITIKSPLLADNINRSLFATAVDMLRPVMTGIYFDLTPDGLTVVASDGHKLVKTELDGVATGNTNAFILPKKPATLLAGMLGKDGDNETTICFNNAKAQISFGDTVMTCTLIEGKYPNYNAVIPLNNTNEATIDRQTLLTSIKRVVPFSNQASNLVRFTFNGSSLQLETEDVDFSKRASEKIACDYKGIPMCVGFKGQAFIDLLNNIDSDTIILKLADPSRAGIVVPGTQPEGQEVLMLLMPMLIV